MKELLKKKMILKDISEPVIENGYTRLRFKNTVTGKEGNSIDSVKTNGKNAIYLPGRMKGFYAEYEQSKDALIIYLLEFSVASNKWKEESRVVFSKKTREQVVSCSYSCTNMVDITGMTYKGYSMPGRCSKVVSDFFGDYFITSSNNIVAFRGSNLTESIGNIGLNFRRGLIDNKRIDINLEGHGEVKKTIPDKLKKRVVRIFRNYMDSNDFIGWDGIIFKDGFRCAYMQKSEKGCIARLFLCLYKAPVTYINGSGTIDIDMFEYARVGIDETLDLTSGRVRDLINVPLFYYDKDIDSGIFKYNLPLLQKMANKAKKTTIATHFIAGEPDYFNNSAYNAVVLAKNSMREKIENSDYPALKRDFEEGLNRFLKSHSNMQLCTLNSKMFGYIYEDKGPLHQMIGIPLYMLKSIGCDTRIKDTTKVIRGIKTMFWESKDYLSSMNKNAVDSLLLCLRRNFSSKMFIPEEKIENITILVKVFGPQNIEGYINFVAKCNEYLYAEYLRRISRISSFVETKDFEWKLKGNELVRSFDSITTAYELYENKRFLAQFENKYKKNKEKWEKYEYESDKLIITYPKSPQDVVKEGITLHHCAKNFVQPVADGQTLMLFIRKKESPDKPYFTLEIRNNAVRQCHGNNNISITNYPKLQRFLKGFCRHYGIRYNIGNEQLGV